jgi:hypothetical protein
MVGEIFWRPLWLATSAESSNLETIFATYLILSRQRHRISLWGRRSSGNIKCRIKEAALVPLCLPRPESKTNAASIFVRARVIRNYQNRYRGSWHFARMSLFVSAILLGVIFMGSLNDELFTNRGSNK